MDLYDFSERLFGKAWREEFVVLYEDSSLIWFRDRDRLDPEGGVFLRDAPEMLAAGQVNQSMSICKHALICKRLIDKSKNTKLQDVLRSSLRILAKV